MGNDPAESHVAAPDASTERAAEGDAIGAAGRPDSETGAISPRHALATRSRSRAGSRKDQPAVAAKVTRRRRAVKWFPYLLLLPALIAELAVHVIPMLVGVWMSVQQITQFTLRDWTRS